MQNPNLLVIGNGRHGKDTVCEHLANHYGFSFESSSRFCSKQFIFNSLKDQHGYVSEEECYADRHAHRQLWYDMIREYSATDPAKLGKEIFNEHNIYCGLRNHREFHAMRNQQVFDYTIWVDRSEHLPPEDASSMSLKIWMADYVIDNNGDLKYLEDRIDELMITLLHHRP
jgi:hypothetical protein